MKRLEAIIERGNDGGFAIYSPTVDGLFGSALTEDEAKADFLSVMDEQAEFYEEKKGVKPSWANADVDFRYDLSGFFMAFPFINVSEFARCIGINPSLMRKYKQGLASASQAQRDNIQKELNALTQRLNLVKF